MAKRRAYYVLSTHWDREWYNSFQDFRFRLVRLMDHILAGLADGRLAGPFQTDGQAIMIEDYLDIRPERRDEIAKLAGNGMLRIGPWYVLPDEFTVSGESLVRNLRLGHQVARSLGGEPSRAGFACDMFGHNSQLPQILAGFGIETAFLWRGTNDTEHRNFIWRGADGTELVCYRFGKIGYCTFAALVRRCGDHSAELEADRFRKDLLEHLDAEAKASDIEALLVFDGGDHLEWDSQAYALMTEILHRPDSPCQLLHTGLDEYGAEMLAGRGRIHTIVEGELREPGRYPGDKDQQWLIPGVLSSRVNLKLANRACETLLCLWAEPFCTLASAAVGAEFAPGFLETAWRWLLQNHPHDSIDGCSIDQVHKDMEYRFDQCRSITERLTTEATTALAAKVDGAIGKDELRVVVFNPMPRPLEEKVELTLHVPADWPGFQEFFGFEAKPAFRVFGADGNEIPYQRLSQATNRTKVRPHDTKFPEGYRTNDVSVALPLSIPAMGYVALTVRAVRENGSVFRHPDRPGLATSERSMANEHLAVDINANGTLNLTDRRTGRSYQGILAFEDCADIGDGWYHGVAVNDQSFVSTACRSDVALLHDGPMQTSFRIRAMMRVPRELDFRNMRRSEEFVELVLDSRVTLRAGQDHLEVETTVDNQADDHRLRVLFPAGVGTDTYLADSQFDVIRRPIALRGDNHEYRELEVETKPQQSWTAVHDDHHGLAVVAAGLLESAVRDLPHRPIALTLLRATRRTVFTEGQPAGQLRGRHTFRYWVVPLEGEPDCSRLCQMGQRICAGLRSVQLRPRDIAECREGGTLPPAGGLLQLDGPAVVTSTRQVGDAMEVRLFNPAAQTAKVVLRLGQAPGWARRYTHFQPVDMKSDPLDEGGPIIDGVVSLELAAKKIVTLRLT